MRAAVKEGNYDLFKMGVPSGVSEKDCHTLYSAVAKGMKIKEEKIREDWEFASLWESYEEKFDDQMKHNPKLQSLKFHLKVFPLHNEGRWPFV